MAQFDISTNVEAISLLGNASVTVSVLSGDVLYYGDSRPVSASSNQGSLTAGGGSQTFTQQTYVVSAGRSTVQATWTPATTGGGGTGTTYGTVPFSMPGSAIIATSPAIRMPAVGTFAGINLSAVGAPVGSGLSVNFLKNGVQFGATLTVPAGTTTAQRSTSALGSFVAGDLVSVQTTAIGSTTAATDVIAQVDFTVP